MVVESHIEVLREDVTFLAGRRAIQARRGRFRNDKARSQAPCKRASIVDGVEAILTRYRAAHCVQSYLRPVHSQAGIDSRKRFKPNANSSSRR